MTMSSPAFRVIGSPRHDDSLSCFFLRSVAHWRMGPCQLLIVMITSVVTALALYNAPVAACNRTFEPFVLRCSITVGDAWLGLKLVAARAECVAQLVWYPSIVPAATGIAHYGAFAPYS